MKLIRYGTHLVLKRGQEKLDLNVLASAFEKYVKADKPHKKNPFIESDFLDEVKNHSSISSNIKVKATNNRIKTKKKTTKASDILHK